VPRLFIPFPLALIYALSLNAAKIKLLYLQSQEPKVGRPIMQHLFDREVLETIGEVGIYYKPTRMPFAQVTNSTDTARFLREIWDKDTLEYSESFFVLSLNRANKIVSYRIVSTGGSSSVIVDIKIILQKAILSHASGIIVAHNHPSGSLKPSTADRNLTKKLQSAAMMMDIPVLDHIILTKESYMSFADEGYL
jgi:DNA repair protein RadC